MILKQHPNREILRMAVCRDIDGHLYGVVMVHWGNIDPEEYVVWAIRADKGREEEGFHTAHGSYVVGINEANAEFNRRTSNWSYIKGRWALDD